MKAKVIDEKGEKVREITLPEFFNSEVREDLIHKVFWAVQKRQQQPYGSYILAGKTVAASGKQSHARRKWKTLYGKGISRVPRKTLSHRGEQFYWVGAFIPGTVGGREAHPPKAIKKQTKINKKENRLAIKSAIAATTLKQIIEKKYPKLKIKVELPIVVDSSIFNNKPKEIVKILEKIIGIKIKKIKKIRAGKGKMRGRTYKTKAKVLLIISKEENAKKLINYGIDVIKTNQLNILALAPGGTPGRLVVWTENAIKELEKLK